MFYQCATADVLHDYDNNSPQSVYLELDNDMEHPKPLLLSRIDTSSSTLDLLQGDREHSSSPGHGLPFHWHVPSRSPSSKFGSKKGKHAASEMRHWHGWKVIVFGSWLNVLLVLIPVSWALDVALPESKTVVFVFCILSMIPLVKLHDLATDELALRIGGSRTGLLNASMSNIVELVIAVTALRKCEIGIVQSTLIGSMLSKLLLVLGMCFFAGGLRFSEQALDSTASQVHTSLLSISVGAVLLPAAYHFALAGGKTLTLEQQKTDILRMSRGVSLVLLVIYFAYLLFQLWSHTHLYKETAASSKRHTVKFPIDTRIRGAKPSRLNLSTAGKWTSPPTSTPPSPTPTPTSRRSPYNISPYASSSQLSLTTAVPAPAANPSVRLVQDAGGSPLSRQSTLLPDDEKMESPNSVLDTLEPETPHERVPELSWTMTLVLLVVVTVMVAVNAEWLVKSMDGISTSISKEWVALILLPVVGSIAECVSAVNTSVKDQLTLSASIAVGSTIQTALFIIPFMITLGWVIQKPLALLFDPFHSVVLYISVQTVGYVVADGKSNWLEGIILMCLYIIVAVAFWFYPGGSTLASSLATCHSTI